MKKVIWDVVIWTAGGKYVGSIAATKATKALEEFCTKGISLDDNLIVKSEVKRRECRL